MQRLISLARRPVAWWRDTFANSSPIGKVLVLVVTLAAACCVCSVPVALLAPDTAEPEPEALGDASRAQATDIPLEAPTAEPTDTPTAEPAATRTPPPTATDAPTATAEPTATTIPTIAPTEPPQPTQPPPPTAEPTQPPAPTEPPPPPEPTAPPVGSSSDVVISGIRANGDINPNEPDEYATITNRGAGVINMAGWRLNAGDEGQDFYFPAFNLAPGASCRVYTNQIHPESCGGQSFGRGDAIWRNSGDCGFLFDATGAQVSRYCY